MFKRRKRGKPIIKCDKCHRIIGNAKPKRKKVGDIDYCYLKCARCGAVYVISATDAALRQDIKRYEELVTRSKDRQPTEKDLREARDLLSANIKRSREIKEQFSLTGV